MNMQPFLWDKKPDQQTRLFWKQYYFKLLPFFSGAWHVTIWHLSYV